MSDSVPRPAGAVIIPAHDEAAVIERTLRTLAAAAGDGTLEVIVVPNGCSDDTAARARAFSGVTVIELGPASKPIAMNAGDRAATAWPRLYLDADIEVEADSVLALFAALEDPSVLAGRTAFVFDTAGASLPVRGYYRARSRIPAPPTRLWGAGGYAVTREGHERFAQFPEVTADDSWFDGMFTAEEKVVVDTVPMRVRTARSAGDLLAVIARQRRGYVELGVAPATGLRARALLRTIRGPVSAADTFWYAALTLIARRRSAATTGQGTARWERDGSSRVAQELRS